MIPRLRIRATVIIRTLYAKIAPLLRVLSLRSAPRRSNSNFFWVSLNFGENMRSIAGVGGFEIEKVI